MFFGRNFTKRLTTKLVMTDIGEIRESHTVEKYDGSNFALWKMHMRFIFQSRDTYSIVDGTITKSSLPTHAEQLQWEKKDKQAIVAILGALDSFHKQEVINCSTSHEMWTQLQAYHDQHSDQCIIALQAKYYNLKLNEGESIALSHYWYLSKLSHSFYFFLVCAHSHLTCIKC